MARTPASRGGPVVYRAKQSGSARRRQLELAQKRQRRLRWIAWIAIASVAVFVVTLAMLSSRPTTSVAKGAAPNFTLLNTSGQAVTLSSFRSRPVLLYFSEGVGCDACFYQMVEIEAHQAEFTRLGVQILPIVMDPVDEVRQEMVRFGLHDPFLIDPIGQVSSAYHVLGLGMHPGLPGHSFVLINSRGQLLWEENYPGMFVSSADLIRQIQSVLANRN